MEDRDYGRCDEAVAKLRKTLKEVEASGDPPDIPDALWKRHQEEAPVIYGMAIAGCYMQCGRCKEALDEFERAGKALQTCADICATSPGICRLKVDLTSKVILPMCEADCAIALSQHEKAKALLDSVSEYLSGGKRESEVCPSCRSDGFYESAGVKVKASLAALRKPQNR